VKVATAVLTYLLAFFRKTLADDKSTALDAVPEHLSTFTLVEKFGATEDALPERQ